MTAFQLFAAGALAGCLTPGLLCLLVFALLLKYNCDWDPDYDHPE